MWQRGCNIRTWWKFKAWFHYIRSSTQCKRIYVSVCMWVCVCVCVRSCRKFRSLEMVIIVWCIRRWEVNRPRNQSPNTFYESSSVVSFVRFHPHIINLFIYLFILLVLFVSSLGLSGPCHYNFRDLPLPSPCILWFVRSKDFIILIIK